MLIRSAAHCIAMYGCHRLCHSHQYVSMIDVLMPQHAEYMLPQDDACDNLQICRYSDYTRTESGLQYQDLREGSGKSAKSGSQVTIDWDGYTIGTAALPERPAQFGAVFCSFCGGI